MPSIRCGTGGQSRTSSSPGISGAARIWVKQGMTQHPQPSEGVWVRQQPYFGVLTSGPLKREIPMALNPHDCGELLGQPQEANTWPEGRMIIHVLACAEKPACMFASTFPSGILRGRNPPNHLVSLPGSRQSWHLHIDGPTHFAQVVYGAISDHDVLQRGYLCTSSHVGGTNTQPCNVCLTLNTMAGVVTVSPGAQKTIYHSAKQ